MPCATVTITQPAPTKPTVSGVTVVKRAEQGWADIFWYQNIAGNITIKVDNVIISQGSYPAAPAAPWTNSTTVNGLAVGTHNICVEAT